MLPNTTTIKIIFICSILALLTAYLSPNDPNAVCIQPGDVRTYGKSVVTVTGGSTCIDINTEDVFIPLGTTLNINVVVLNWQPGYIFPYPPENVDHKSSDIYEISTWVLNSQGKLSPYAYPGPIDDPTYGQAKWTRGEDLPLTDPNTWRDRLPSGDNQANTWREKFGDKWMLLGIFPGYVGIAPGTYVWVVKNTRTNKTWEILKITQRGRIDCENLVDGKCVAVVDDLPLMPPNPPMLITTGKVSTLIDRTGWSVTVDDTEQSNATKAEQYDKSHAIDADVTTIWHTKWTDPPTPMPHWIIVDMQNIHKVNSIIITPRPYDSTKPYSANSNVKDYKISVSTDNINWQLVHEGTLAFIDGASQKVEFTPTNARYIKLDILSASGNTPAVCLGDIKFTEIK